MVEIQPAAERVLDVRATRRLMTIELADVVVPASEGGLPPALFYRVIAMNETLLRVELWERGELADSRLVSSAQSSSHLVARRVALAAAELARRLRQKRLIERRRAQKQRELERARAAELAGRTREGPVALRAELGAASSGKLHLFGPGTTAEITLLRATRLDLGARFLGGADDERLARLGVLELELGPAHRLKLGQRLDLDLGVGASAALVRVGGASSVDAIDDQTTTWTARALFGVRLEPRLARDVRGSFGLTGAAILRSIPARIDGEDRRFDGLFLGATLGVVITPAR